MKHSIAQIVAILLSVAASPCQAECEVVPPGTFRVCQRAEVTTISLLGGCGQGGLVTGQGRRFGKDRVITGITSFLAGEAGAVVYYFSELTEKDTDCSDIEGSDPSTIMKAIADRVGLRLEVPRRDTWIVGRPLAFETAGLEVSLRPVYADQHQFRNSSDTLSIESALTRGLRVNSRIPSKGTARIRYYYWWIEGERDSLIVTVRIESEDQLQLMFATHKVTVAHTNGTWRVNPVWQAEDSPGPLVPEFSDDIDGDGVRDYVLDYEARDNSHYALISGVDGRLLARFRGWIAYDPGRPGPKRIAVRELLGEYREPPQGVHVLDFSGGTPAEISIPRKKQGTGAGHDSSPYGPDAAVSRLLGDPGRVKSIVGGTYSNEERASPEAMRKAQERRNLPRCELGEQAAGACERVHFRYISPGLKKRMEDAAKRTADSK